MTAHVAIQTAVIAVIAVTGSDGGDVRTAIIRGGNLRLRRPGGGRILLRGVNLRLLRLLLRLRGLSATEGDQRVVGLLGGALRADEQGLHLPGVSRWFR